MYIDDKNSTYYTKHTILTSPHHITYTNDNGKKSLICIYKAYSNYS